METNVTTNDLIDAEEPEEILAETVSMPAVPGSALMPEVLDPVALSEARPITGFTDPLPEDVDECLHSIQSSVVDAARYSVLRFWYIGRVIDELGRRGIKNVLQLVSKKTKYKRRAMQYCLTVFQRIPDYPKLMKAAEVLEWSDVRNLASVRDEGKRNQLLSKAASSEADKKEILSEINSTLKAEKGTEAADSAEEEDKKSPVPDSCPVKQPASWLTKLESNVTQLRHQLEENRADMTDFASYMCDPRKTDEKKFDEWHVHTEKVRLSLERMMNTVYDFMEMCPFDPRKHKRTSTLPFKIVSLKKDA